MIMMMMMMMMMMITPTTYQTRQRCQIIQTRGALRLTGAGCQRPTNARVPQ